MFYKTYATFADAAHMRAGAECDRLAVEARQLGQAKAGLDRKRQQGMIAAAEPPAPIR
jgi:hypothetical protein